MRHPFLKKQRFPTWRRPAHSRRAASQRRLKCETLELRQLLAVVTVNTLVDEADGSITDGDISLRDAIATAADGDIIDFDEALGGGTILLTLGELLVTRSMTIDASAIPQRVTIDASGNDPTPDVNQNDGSRIFLIDDREDSVVSEVTLSGLTLTGGDVGSDGGAVCSRENLSIEKTTISHNHSGSSGGGVGCQTTPQALLTIRSSRIVDNSAANSGGAVNASAFSIESSTISGNVSGFRGAISLRPKAYPRSNMNYTPSTITSSTISNNRESSEHFRGGVFVGRNMSLSVTSSTISGNSAFGISAQTDDFCPQEFCYYYSADLRVTSTTITNNAAGGVAVWIGGFANVEVDSSIVAGNGVDFVCVNFDPCPLWFSKTTNSLIGNATRVPEMGEPPLGMPDENGNFVGDADGIGEIDPRLGPLANNGGATQTHALLPGSLAINMGAPDIAEPPTYDQRGKPFERISGGRIDMGAFEYQIAPVDFDDDGLLGCTDINALTAAIVDGANSPTFDLTGDARVNQDDLGVWLSLAGLENLPSHQAYLSGDANLDGKVNAVDLNIIGLNWSQDSDGWCNGDFTADGVVRAEDLNSLGLNWLKDVSAPLADMARTRAPRAPLDNHTPTVDSTVSDRPNVPDGDYDTRQDVLGDKLARRGAVRRRSLQSSTQQESPVMMAGNELLMMYWRTGPISRESTRDHPGRGSGRPRITRQPSRSDNRPPHDCR